MIDIEAIRAEFPALRQTVHGRPLAYLDNAATTQRPRAVVEAIQRFLLHDNANVHRGVHALAERATAAYEQARARVAAWIHARAPEEIVFVRGTTEAINLVAASWGMANLGAGDEVLITEMEHHANIVPWRVLCDRTGARLVVAPIKDDGALDMDAFAARLNARTKLVAITHLSNALGVINPIEEVCALAKPRGARVLVDGAQALAHLDIDVQALGCDFYAASAHKAYGPFGIGFLWAKAELLDEMPPYQTGGEMIRTVSFDAVSFADPPHKFEAGTPNVSGAVGFAAALDWMASLDREAVRAHEEKLVHYAMEKLHTIPRVRLFGTAQPRAAVVSFAVDGVHAHDIGTIADRNGVAIRAGHHCAMPLMHRLNVAATARASFACYNTTDEVDALADAVRDAIRLLG
ncbi:MAG: cysteine desulfurase [Zetaproteobacteria bacterium]|nr:MAG: cysteine desulfurase [Zetaproteobacteria bacterium]